MAAGLKVDGYSIVFKDLNEFNYPFSVPFPTCLGWIEAAPLSSQLQTPLDTGVEVPQGFSFYRVSLQKLWWSLP